MSQVWVVHTCNPNTPETKAEDYKFEASLQSEILSKTNK
jgi:flagellar basal body rod protein FlgB